MCTHHRDFVSATPAAAAAAAAAGEAPCWLRAGKVALLLTPQVLPVAAIRM